MPIYEYHCEQCGTFEEMQRITDTPLAKCPRCRKKVRRLMSNTSFQLKGSGWYVTDYARGGNGGKKDGGADAGGDAKSGDTKSESKGDSKKESKAESKSKSGGDAKPTTSGDKSAS
jgi:putative FmdB family regulatory protein